jgi:hypothetical protein
MLCIHNVHFDVISDIYVLMHGGFFIFYSLVSSFNVSVQEIFYIMYYYNDVKVALMTYLLDNV